MSYQGNPKTYKEEKMVLDWSHFEKNPGRNNAKRSGMKRRTILCIDV